MARPEKQFESSSGSEVRARNCGASSAPGFVNNEPLKIPNPRKFIEIVLCFIVASVFLACFALVVFVMMVFAAVENVVDRVRWVR